jgi:hypothetical protein
MTNWLEEICELSAEKKVVCAGVTHLQNLQNPEKEVLSVLLVPRNTDRATSRLERIAKWKDHPIDDLLDWYRDDLDHLATLSDRDLQFVVCEYLDNLEHYGREIPEEPFKPHTVQCIDCQYFTRIDHPHLGHCGACVPESLAGMWDTGLRGCGKYIETADAEEHEK